MNVFDRAVNLVARLFGIETDPPRHYPYVAQAELDQRLAYYPGCRLGYMDCFSQSCSCNEGRPCSAFITERARYLRERDSDRKLGLAAPRAVSTPRDVLKKRGWELAGMCTSAVSDGVRWEVRKIERVVEQRWPGTTEDELDYLIDCVRGVDPDWDLKTEKSDA